MLNLSQTGITGGLRGQLGVKVSTLFDAVTQDFTLNPTCKMFERVAIRLSVKNSDLKSGSFLLTLSCVYGNCTCPCCRCGLR